MFKNNKKTMKTLVFSLVLAALTLTANHLNAQNDGSRGLFGLGKSSADYDNSGNRDGGGISNQTFELETGGPSTPIEAAPIGSGLLILTAAGAGYAIARRKRNLKHGSTLLLAFALLLGMTNCKKTDETITPPETNTVQITLDIISDSRVNINTGTGVVTFGIGDRINVGNNGKYCGYLVHDGSKFTGDIAPTSTDDYLHFYFMGNRLPYNNNLVPNSTTTFDIFISNQTSGLPLISYAPSTIKYTPGTTSYTAMLRNYCSLVKFYTSESIPTNYDIELIDNGPRVIKNKVNVDFTANNAATGTSGEPYNYSATGTGITLYAESANVRWAVFVEQEEIPEFINSSKIVVPFASYDNKLYNGSLALPAIEKNHIYTNNNDGYNLNLLASIIIDGATICFNTGETWYEAKDKHSSENSGWDVDGGTVYYYDQQLFDGSGNSVYSYQEIDPYYNYTFSSGSSGGSSGELLDLPIEFAIIYYEEGETWEEAICRHDNPGWEINGDDVYCMGRPLLMGPGSGMQVERDMPIMPGMDYHF